MLSRCVAVLAGVGILASPLLAEAADPSMILSGKLSAAGLATDGGPGAEIMASAPSPFERPNGVLYQRPVNVWPVAEVPEEFRDCILRAASQQAGSHIVAPVDAMRRLQSLARAIHEPGTSGDLAHEHRLYVICPSPRGDVAKAINPQGVLTDDPEGNRIISGLGRARALARTVGLASPSPAEAPDVQSPVGDWPSLITIGPEKIEPVLGAFRPRTRTISIRSGIREELEPSILLHETAHFLLGTAPRLNEPAARTRFFSSPVVRTINESFAYTVQIAAAYATTLQGNTELSRASLSAGVNGTNYLLMAAKVAKEFPDLRNRFRDEGRLPNAFLVKLFGMIVAEPTIYDLKKVRLRPGYSASISEAQEILPHLYFLDAESQARMIELIQNTNWFTLMRQGKEGQALVEAVKAGQPLSASKDAPGMGAGTTESAAGDKTVKAGRELQDTSPPSIP